MCWSDLGEQRIFVSDDELGARKLRVSIANI